MTGDEDSRDPLRQARLCLKHFRPLVVLTGAGISAEYGLPTFRGDGQLWRGRQIQELLTPETYRTDRRLVWDWHLEIREKSAGIVDPLIHRQLANWSRLDEQVHVITQNIDGLHERAHQERLLRLHGSVWSNRCVACQRTRPDTTLHYEVLPRCSHCRDGRERPDVLWYGESLDRRLYRRAQSLVSSARLLLVIGTSGSVYPAADIVPYARRRGVMVIDINPVNSDIVSDLAIRHRVSNVSRSLFISG